MQIIIRCCSWPYQNKSFTSFWITAHQLRYYSTLHNVNSSKQDFDSETNPSLPADLKTSGKAGPAAI